MIVVLGRRRRNDALVTRQLKQLDGVLPRRGGCAVDQDGSVGVGRGRLGREGRRNRELQVVEESEERGDEVVGNGGCSVERDVGILGYLHVAR